MRFYAGIGSRKTPEKVLNRMEAWGSMLAGWGLVLRSGAAEGADSAFERGCDLKGGGKEIYLPWPYFNNHKSELNQPSTEAFTIAERYHPAWYKCTPAARKLHARNVHQLLGQDLQTPVLFVLCWHQNSGGTMQAVRIANKYKIPVYNLAASVYDMDLFKYLEAYSHAKTKVNK
jgi:hypothetical protein